MHASIAGESVPVRPFFLMILIPYGAGHITRPLSSRRFLPLTMIPVWCQRGQGHVGHTFLLLRFWLLLDLQRDRWSLSVHARLCHRFTIGLTSRGNIFRPLGRSNSSRRRECPVPLPVNWVSPSNKIPCKLCSRQRMRIFNRFNAIFLRYSFFGI